MRTIGKTAAINKTVVDVFQIPGIEHVCLQQVPIEIDRALCGILVRSIFSGVYTMIKVFEDFELLKVGQFQSVLEVQRVATRAGTGPGGIDAIKQ